MLNRLKKDVILYRFFLAGLVADLVLTMVILVFFRKLPPQMPLLYSLPWGEAQLVPWWAIAVLPLGALTLICLDTWLAVWLNPKEPTLSRMVAAGGAMATLLLATTGIKIILLTHF